MVASDEWVTCPECEGVGTFPDGPGFVRCAECGGEGGWEPQDDQEQPE